VNISYSVEAAEDAHMVETPILQKLYLAIQEFREAMEANGPLHDLDRVCLENYIALLQITYIEWQRRNDPPAEEKHAA
jgi:hypothetical protein